MSKIDWSKAPEWADGHGLVAHHGITEVWINMDQYAVVGSEDRAYPYGGGTGDHRHNFTRGQIQYITPRPARWDGEGPPPVGTVCELRRKDGGWGKATINYISNTTCVWLWDNGNPDQREWACEPWNMEFRRIRTPKQIAAEEREKAIETIRQLLSNVACDDFHAAVAIYDAGYRKQVAP